MNMLKIAFLLLLTASCATKNYQLATGTKSSAFQAVPLSVTHVGSQVGSQESSGASSRAAYRKTYPNGLKLVVVEDHRSPTFAYQTWFNVGSRDEQPGLTGLAHLFEHMMFKGTSNYAEGLFDKLMDQAGAEGQNAFTSHDYTAYIEELPSSKLEFVAQIESDRMVNLIVNDQSFSTEREVVQNERRFRIENNPDGKMYQEMYDLSFTRHSYHWPVIGYEADLNRMTAEDARKFYKLHYAPDNATVVVVGDVDRSKVDGIIEKYYGAIPATHRKLAPPPKEPVQTAPREKTLKLNVQVEKLMISFPIPDISHPDIPALNMLQYMLAEGKSSRLHRALVETGIATGVGSWGADNKDPTLFIVSASMQSGKTAKQAEEIILKEISKISTEQPSERELERARNQMSFSLYEMLGSGPSLTQFIGRFEILAGGFEHGLKIQELTAATPAKDVSRVAKLYLNSSKRNTLYGVPK